MLALGMLVLAAGAFAWLWPRPDPGVLEANGQVRGTEVTVSAKAGGVLEVVAVREGTQVAKACMCRSQSGAPLMELALGIILKGVGIDVLWPQLAGLAAVGTALMRAALARLRRHLYV